MQRYLCNLLIVKNNIKVILHRHGEICVCVYHTDSVREVRYQVVTDTNCTNLLFWDICGIDPLILPLWHFPAHGSCSTACICQSDQLPALSHYSAGRTCCRVLALSKLIIAHWSIISWCIVKAADCYKLKKNSTGKYLWSTTLAQLYVW